MTWKVILLGLVVGSQAIRIPISEPKIKRLVHAEQRSELSHIGSHKPEHHEEYASAYPSYEFSYTVNDPHTHDYKGQQEKRHGDEVIGEYWLLQPDGKIRTVKYQADKHKGFTAHVEYTHHHDHKEPHHEHIIKPVEEIFIEHEPSQAEMPEPIEEEVRDDESEQQGEEQIDEKEQKEDRNEEKEEHHEEIHEEKHKEKHVGHKPHGPIHIEYYILHKYQHHHDEPEEKPEPKEEKYEEHHEPIKPHKPVPLEIFSKIHHPIHNEHHGHVTHKVHEPVIGRYNHDIPYKPLINYKRPHHKAAEHKSPLLHLSQINGEQEERYSEELSPIRVSEHQAERKHHIEQPSHIPPLRMHKPMIHRQHNHYHKENNRRHHRSHGKQFTTSQ